MTEEYNGKIAVSDAVILDKVFKNIPIEKAKWNLAKAKDRKGIISLVQGGNGRRALSDFDSLPIEWQNLIGDPRKQTDPLEKYFRTDDNEAVRFYVNYKTQEGNYLKAEVQNKCILRSNILKALINLEADIIKERKRKGLNTLGIDQILLEHSVTFQKTLKVKHGVQHDLPGTPKHLKKLLKSFKDNGYVSLITGKIGNDNSLKADAKMIALIKRIYVDFSKPNPTETQKIYTDFLSEKIEIVDNSTGELFNPKEYKKMSVGSFRRLLTKKWDNIIDTARIRIGDNQKLMQQIKPYASTQRPSKSGSILSIDDMQLAFEMLNGKRMWFYLAIDLASGAIVCWVWGKTKEGLIINFYRQLIRNLAEWGLKMPAELECEMSLNSSFQTTFLREGAMFEYVHIAPNSARTKRIERYIRDLRYNFEKKRPNYKFRPFAKSESNLAGTNKAKQMHEDEIINGFLEDIETWNNLPHPIENDLSVWEYWLQKQHPDLRPINYPAILPHLGYKTPTSCNAGIIKFNYSEFLLAEDGEIVVDEKLIRLMKLVDGQNVIVYWLDDNLGKVLKALVYIDTLLICEAIPKPIFNRAQKERKAEDHAAYKLMNKYIATIEKYGRSRKKAIEPITIIDNNPKIKKTFTIRELNRTSPVIKGWGEATALPDLPNENDMPPIQVAKSFVKPLKDRL